MVSTGFVFSWFWILFQHSGSMFCSTPVLFWIFPNTFVPILLVSMEAKILHKISAEVLLLSTIRNNAKPLKFAYSWQEKGKKMNWRWILFKKNPSEYYKPFFWITGFTKLHITLLPNNHSSSSYICNLKRKISNSSPWH